MERHPYNNIGIGAIGMISVLNHCKTMPLSKAALILPFIAHKELLSYLSRKTTNVMSIEKLITDKIACFSNFNRRYYDSLILTIESVQFLIEMDFAAYNDSSIFLVEHVPYSSTMGTRASKIYQAAENLSKILSEDIGKLYLNLRIKL